MHICIVGSGISGATLANELALISDFKISVIDTDFLNSSKSGINKLKVEFANNSIGRDQVTFYNGFGGTSNLWHGLITDPDKKDKVVYNQKGNFWNRISVGKKHIRKYLNHYENLNNLNFTKLLNLKKILDLDNFHLKQFSLQSRPTRFKEFLVNHNKTNRINFIENSVVLSINEIKDGVRVNFSSNGKLNSIDFNLAVLCAGAIESPRILNQSGLNYKNNKLNILDHPTYFAGLVTTKKRLNLNAYGRTGFLRNKDTRYGLLLSDKKIKNNHSIFLRPINSNNIEKFKKSIKIFISEKSFFKNITNIFLNIHLLPTVFIFILNKLGINYKTRNFLISYQLDLPKSDDCFIEFQKNRDKFGRKIPKVNICIGKEIKADISYLNKILIGSLKKSQIRRTTFRGFESDNFISGSHFSSTLEIGESTKYFVDLNLKLKSYSSVYVCDASVLPRTGNSNLSVVLCLTSIYLANYLKNEYE